MNINRRTIVAVLLTIGLAGCNEITGNSDIEYRITGLDVQRVSVTYESGSGTSQVASAALPWSYSFKAERDGFLYVSAQIIQGTGGIQVVIRKNGDIKHSASATGFAAIATASGSN